MVEFRTQRRVEFADTDMGGIMHFSRFFVFMETAEHECWEALGTRVTLEHEGQKIGWPRVTASCTYRSPARFGDLLEIRVSLVRRGERSVTWGFDFTRGGVEVASGEMTAVCCVLEPGAEVRSIPIPDTIAERLD